jgi:hypothetical protein
MDRIDPHEHAIRYQQLRANLVREFLIVNRGLRIDAERREFFKSR